ncbi:hypothetical protein B0H19DRAFT_930041 [Mycena capillaripes]|nr:hypothetical protein B0H19DRAFT_930041 [Mycena capillaripes]
MRIFDFEGVQFKDGEKYVVFLVPKFHLPAHIELCNILFSFNLTPFVGRTDGEAPERGWANTNRLANSTSVSGPGARRDALDVHFQDWNWKKLVALGAVLLKRLQKSVPLMLETQEALNDLEASFPPVVIETWTAMAVAWEQDVSAPNPFASTIKHENLQHVRRKLAEIASEDIEQLRVRGDMHETEMLSMGLQLEEQQRALATHVKHIGAHETIDQGRRRIERETKLRRKIDAWMAVQQLFIPEVTLLREREDAERRRVAATQAMAGMRAQDMKLWMPSAIARRVQCDQGLQEYEYMLRKGQAIEALDELRNRLLLRTRQYKFKDGAIRGVKGNTRAAARIEGIDAQIHRAAEQYRAARVALVSLGSLLDRTEWKQHLQVLNAADIRGLPRALPARPNRETWWRTKVSHSSVASHQAYGNPALRIEWAKTRARSMRYTEEVDLLQEEMRRVVQFMDWRRDWWRSLVGLRAAVQPDTALREGHSAYAHKQAAYMGGLSTRFQKLWEDVPKFLDEASTLFTSLQGDDDGEGEDLEDGTAWLSD